MQSQQRTTENFDAVIKEARQDVERIGYAICAAIEGLNPPDIIEWAEKTLKLPEGESQGGEYIKFEPYQILPIKAQLIPGVEVLISMIEQSGKTTCWKVVCIYKARFMPGPTLIVYESKSKAEDINEESFRPLMISEPYFAELYKEKPDLFLKDKYKLPGSWIDVQGAGSEITSKARQYIFNDEIDSQPLTPEKQKTQCDNARNRTRSFEKYLKQNIVWCGSFRRDFRTSTLWYLASDTNLAFWHLRCLKCKNLTINSTSYEVKFIAGSQPRFVAISQKVLKYETDEANKLIKESCRLICPECNHEHKVDDLPKMSKDIEQYIDRTGQIVKEEDIKPGDKLSFINGGLGSRINNLVKLCESDLRMKQSRSLEIKRKIMNSDFGLPIDPGIVSGSKEEQLDSHCIERIRDKKKFDYVLLAMDTQTSPFGWYWVARGYNKNGSHYITSDFLSILKEDLTVDKEKTIKAAEKLFNREFTGHKSLFVIIDQGGTHAKIVKDLVKGKPKIFQYKGEGGKSSKVVRFSKEKGQKRLILALEKQINADLRYHIYHDDNTSWFLPNEGLHPEYKRHILNINPDTGDQIQPDYVCRKDYFDCEKMLIALEYALEYRIKKHLERLKQQKKEEKPPKELHNKPKTLENITKKASINKGTPVNKGGFVNSW